MITEEKAKDTTVKGVILTFLRRQRELVVKEKPASDESDRGVHQLAACDDRLFNRIRHNPQHVLYSLLAPPQNYDLRPRQHDRQLPAHASHLMDCDFITWILYKDAY